MHDPAPVGEGEPLGDGGHDGGGQAGRGGQGADAVEPGAQRLALQVLHGDEGGVAEDVAVVHLDDGGMAQPRQGARLGEQPAIVSGSASTWGCSSLTARMQPR